ncbi:MAG: hypothetical protein K8I00_11535, partial [Candidatus Omnitrophica bacterium]|nr:hypothetical protein [Candidatus Omnitrophota bacterium]
MNTDFQNNLAKKTITTKGATYSYYDIRELSRLGFGDPSKLPFSIKVLLESALRNFDGYAVT